MYFITTKRMLEVCFSAHPNIQYRTYFQMSDRHSLAPSGAVTAVSAIDSNCDTAIACLEGAG